MSNQLAVREEMAIADIATAFVKSGFFQDTRDQSQAIVKILAGREFGFGAFSSMTGIDIIQGRPSVGVDLQASAVKRSARYDYRVREMSAINCTIEFFERVNGRLESLGVSTFNLDDAKKAGTKNLERFPRNMLFARAMSNGVKWYCPDVFGTSVYTPEELGLSVDDNGHAVDAQPAAPVHPEPQNGNGQTPTPEAWAKWNALADEADKLGLPVYEYTDNCTVDELRAAYVKLRAEIKETREELQNEAARSEMNQGADD